MRAASFMMGCALVFGSHDAIGEPELFRVVYEAPPGCPTGEQFAAKLGERSSRAQLASEPVLARVVHVRIQSSGGEFVGVVDTLNHAGRPVRRSVRGSSCDEIVEALSLVGALALDSMAADVPGESNDVPAGPTRWLVGPTGDELPWPPVELVPDVRPDQPSGPSRQWLVSVLASVENGWSPEWAPAGWVILEHRWPNIRARAGIGVASAGRVLVDGEQARFDWIGGIAAACHPIADVEVLSLGACLWAQFGAIRGEGIPGGTIVETRAAWRQWLAPGPALELSRRLGSSARVDLDLGVLLPIFRPEFVFDTPRREAHETPSVAAWAGVGLAFGIL